METAEMRNLIEDKKFLFLVAKVVLENNYGINNRIMAF